MSAGLRERARTSIVGRGIEAIARIARAEALDQSEDAIVGRIHKHVHELERIDRLDDENRAALREDLRALTGYVDGLTPAQLPLLDAAEPQPMVAS